MILPKIFLERRQITRFFFSSNRNKRNNSVECTKFSFYLVNGSVSSRPYLLCYMGVISCQRKFNFFCVSSKQLEKWHGIKTDEEENTLDLSQTAQTISVIFHIVYRLLVPILPPLIITKYLILDHISWRMKWKIPWPQTRLLYFTHKIVIDEGYRLPFKWIRKEEKVDMEAVKYEK